ncbi:MAG: sulfotransferase domain-containing protein [Deltaproteobacteria bacterium]|nr:sulfotransferase domain-containing protein [Deltaproteobacteria bacterium]
MKKNIAPVRFPLFVVAGMPRGATTFLYNYLEKHPGIFLPFRKEVNYFTVNYDRGVKWYHSLYKNRQPHQIAGDISPPCFLDPSSLGRMAAYDPDIKVILVIRDPVEWVLSFYQQFNSFTFNMPSFADFLEGYDYRANNKVLRVESKNNVLVDRIDLFRKTFGSHLLLYDYGFFKQNVLTVLQVIERFIGVDGYFNQNNFQNLKINASGRNNIKLISYLLSREWLIAPLQYVVPRKITLYFRDTFDRRSVKKQQRETAFQHPEENIRLAETVLGSQRDTITKQFADRPIQLGTGERFP